MYYSNYPRKLSVLFVVFNLVASAINAQINTSKPVGVLEGAANVSTDGTGTYTVPIKLPRGVAGMQPTLALTYSSRNTDGLAGWGWNLAGISSITRGNQTVYYNGLTLPVKQNETDNFYLDGQLLMPVTGTNGGNGTVYKTESDSYEKIESFGTVAGDPQTWKITNKDGSTVEYGVSANDKLAATANLVWYASVAKDINNNAINYTYGIVENERILVSILYANVTVQFEYSTKQNRNVSFIGGKGITNSRILTGIGIKVNNTQVTYKLKHIVKINRNYLESIELIGTDNTSSVLNTFNYGSPDYEESISTFSGTYERPFDNVTITPGDFDGDGRTDMVVADRIGTVNADGSGLEKITSSAYNVITNVGAKDRGALEASKYELTYRYMPTTYMKPNEYTPPFSYYTSDFSGNGKDGILRPKKIYHRYPDGKGGFREDGMNYADSIFVENFTKTGTTMTVNSTYIPMPVSLGLKYDFYLKESNSFIQGDFDGDGRVDIISVLGNKYQSGSSGVTPIYDYNFKGFFTNTSKSYINAEIFGIDNAFKDAQAIYPIDFDGDGKQELLVLKNAGSYVYSIDGVAPSSGYLFKAAQIVSATNVKFSAYKRVLTGDFNGDRKTDLIGIGTSQYAAIFYSTGTEFGQASLYLDRAPNFSTVWFDYFATGDFNGDGITDLFRYYNYPLGSSSIEKQTIHYFKGMNYSPGYIRSGQNLYCSIDPIPYSNYTILFKVPNYCQDPVDHLNYDGWMIEWYENAPATYSPLYTVAEGYTTGMVDNMAYSCPPEVGDFNGDGKVEVIQATGGSNYVILEGFGADKSSSLLHNVTDGFSNSTIFSYSAVAEKTPEKIYSNTGEVSVSYPLNLMPVPLNVVTKITDEGLQGRTTKAFRYQDAVMDRQKGFLGFRKTLSIQNDELNERTENQLNTQYRILIPYKKASYYRLATGTTDEMLSTSETGVTITPLTNNFTRNYMVNRFKLQTTSTLQVNSLSGSAVKKQFVYDSYDNVTKETTTSGYMSGSTFTTQETAVSTTEYTKTGKALIPISPSRVVLTNSKGAGTATRITTSTYTADKGLLATQVSWAETALASTMSYTYNSNGNLTQTVNSVPGKPTVTSTSTYDANQRFPITNTVTCDNVTRTSSMTNHQYWGVLLSKTDGDGTTGSLTTAYEYDALGKLIKTTTPLGHQIVESDVWDVSIPQYIYYHFIDYPDGVGADQKIWYDNLGRIVKTQTLGWNNKWITQTKSYDVWGRESTSTAPYYEGEEILTNTNNYDRLYRLSSVVTPAGTNTLTYSYPGSGQTKVTEMNAAFQTSSKTTDATGLVIAVTDIGGSIANNYDERGSLVSASVNGITMVTNTYDSYGRKTKSVEPNTGTVSYEYDASDNMTKITDANNKVINMVYDGLNRISSRTTPEGTISYEYYNTATNKELKKVSNANHSVEYLYDNYRRVTKKTEVITAEGTFNTAYEYNTNNNVAATVYPNGTRVENQYNNAGLLSKVVSGGATLYEAINYDGQGHATNYKLVNGLQTTDTYSQGLPNRYYTAGIQDLRFNFEYSTGNLMGRRDAIKSITEAFLHDNLNRLTTGVVANVKQFEITYDGNTSQSKGNIATKSDIGTYTYLDRKPHAVGFISPLTNSSLATQPASTITYTSFQRPLKIVKGTSTLDLIYGVEDERVKTVKNVNGVIENKLFLSSYEKQTIGSTVNNIVYVAGGNGLCAMIVNGTPYAVYADHLGSILTVTNSAGTIVAQQNFDAWGRRRNVTNWTYTSVGEETLPAWLYRGFTGHEHLVDFGLINMNARLYDPYNGRMLSADNILNTNWGTQGFNKYSYANNNPLKYIDPTGDDPLLVAVIIGFAMGAYSGGTMANEGEMNPLKWDFNSGRTWGYMLGGGVVGGVSAGFGASVAAGSAYMSNTLGAMASSFMNSMGMAVITGGAVSPSINFGVASLDLSNNTWGYPFKGGNKLYTNISYTMGALGNIQDLVNGWWAKDYQYQYEYQKDGSGVGHANVREVVVDPVTGVTSTKVKISVANVEGIMQTIPNEIQGVKRTLIWAWRANFRKYSHGAKFWDPPVPEEGWPRIPLKLNHRIINWMNKNINPDLVKNPKAVPKDIWGFGKLNFGLNFGCVSYAARALWTVGVPTIPIINYAGPRVLWIQLAIRHGGIISAPIFDALPD